MVLGTRCGVKRHPIFFPAQNLPISLVAQPLSAVSWSCRSRLITGSGVAIDPFPDPGIMRDPAGATAANAPANSVVNQIDQGISEIPDLSGISNETDGIPVSFSDPSPHRDGAPKDVRKRLSTGLDPASQRVAFRFYAPENNHIVRRSFDIVP